MHFAITFVAAAAFMTACSPSYSADLQANPSDTLGGEDACGEPHRKATSLQQGLLRSGPGSHPARTATGLLNLYSRADFSRCQRARTGRWPHTIDSYQTVWSEKSFSCNLQEDVRNFVADGARVLSDDDGCYLAFQATQQASPAAAVALWMFSLTEDGIGPLGRPDVLQVTENTRTGDPFLDGFVNRGVLTVRSPSWPGSQTVKFTSGYEIARLAKRMMSPAVSTNCLAGLLQEQETDAAPEEHDLQTLPSFAVPLAMGLFCEKGEQDKGCAEDGPFSSGIVLMHTAEGRHPMRGEAPETPSDWDLSMHEAWLEGRALALFQMPFVVDDGRGLNAQAVWAHYDLHHGNVVINAVTGQVHFLDFEKMGLAHNWIGTGHGDDPTRLYGTLAAATDTVIRLLSTYPHGQSSCLDGLEAWLMQPVVASALRADSSLWLADRQRFIQAARGYLQHTPVFARTEATAHFEAACRRIVDNEGVQG